MSDGDALRAAIRANPTEVAARLVFADWLDENAEPGGDLVRALVKSSLWESVLAVVNWFHRHHGWPVPERLFASQWVGDALVAERWPDPARLRSCVATIAARMLPVAEHDLPADNAFLLMLRDLARLRDGDDPDPPARVSFAAAHVAEMCLSIPGDGFGDASNQEYCEQVQVIAWVWLGLPPLRPVLVTFTDPIVPAVPGALFQLQTPGRRSWWRRLFGG